MGQHSYTFNNRNPSINQSVVDNNRVVTDMSVFHSGDQISEQQYMINDKGLIWKYLFD